jgi:hypothetical protein
MSRTAFIVLILALQLGMTALAFGVQGVESVEARAQRERAAEKAYAPALRLYRLGGGTNLRENPRDINWHIDWAVDNRPLTNEQRLAQSACASALVAVATVTAERGFLTSDATSILTEYTLSITQLLRGESGQKEIRYIRPGGRVNLGDKWIRTSDDNFPPLQVGSEYVVFLQHDPGADFFRSSVDLNWLDVMDVRQGKAFQSFRATTSLRDGEAMPTVVSAVRGARCLVK